MPVKTSLTVQCGRVNSGAETALIAGESRAPAGTLMCETSRSAAARIVEDVQRALDRNPAGARAIAVQLVQLLSQPVTNYGDVARGGLTPWQQRTIDNYMRENLENPLRLGELAKQVSLSVSHLCRAFKQSFGITVNQRLARLRVERAQHLMLTTSEPLSQIALACGLADQAHFSKLFRRVLGEPPNVWRRRNMTGVRAGLHQRSTVGRARASASCSLE